MRTVTDGQFCRSREDLPGLRERYENCSPEEKRLLHQFVHVERAPGADTIDRLPTRYETALESLLESDLLQRGDGTVTVIPDLVYLPDGPGRRWDQLPGVLHRLPEQYVRDWWHVLGGEQADETDTYLVYRRLAGEISGADSDDGDGEKIDSLFDGRAWMSPGELPEPLRVPASLDELYRADSVEENTLIDGLLSGCCFPVWDQSHELRGIVRASRRRDGDAAEPLRAGATPAVDEKDWDRSPFSLAEQLKIALIVNDALPLRLTDDDDPHRFDLKEAARITDWNLPHVDYLTNFVVELGFLDARGDRFFITDRYLEWERDETTLDPLLTGLVPVDGEDDFRTEFHDDLSFGFLIESLLDALDGLEVGISLQTLLEQFHQQETVLSVLMGRPLAGEDYSGEARTLLRRTLELLYWLGLCDRWTEDGTRYRINERGRRLLEGAEFGVETEDELPLILQPDGQLMLPLECPMETFRHVNPFGLIVKVDRMIVYQVDDKSLVQALNEGWDARGFRDFLHGTVRELPNPMEELFDDILEDVEDVSIEDAHHLLRFETGATAAKAMNVLNNYNPSRLDERTLVLHSKTTEETIRRNLSRGGIRLRTDSEQGASSPIVEFPD